LVLGKYSSMWATPMRVDLSTCTHLYRVREMNVAWN
jgi:hypothetical protein